MIAQTQMRGGAAAVLALGAACRVGQAQPPAARAEAGACPDELVAHVCDNRAGCELESRTEPVRTPHGEKVMALALRLAPQPTDGQTAHGVGDTWPDGGAVTCSPREVWLVWPSSARPRRQIFGDCVDSEWPGSLSVLGPNRIRYSHPVMAYGVGPIPRDYQIDFSLDPVQQERFSDGLMEWDWESLSGGEIDPGASPYLALFLPRVDSIAGFDDGGWKTTSLGECSLRMGRDEKRALIKDADATVRALTIDMDLFLEVEDPAIGSPYFPIREIQLYGWFNPESNLLFELDMNGNLTRVPRPGEQAQRSRVEMVSPTPTLRRFRLRHLFADKDVRVRISYGEIKSHVMNAVLASASDYAEHEYSQVFSLANAECVVRDGALHADRSPLLGISTSALPPWDVPYGSTLR
jgi:hypothetical protein